MTKVGLLFRVLGPVSVERDGTPLLLAERMRTLLAGLLVQANRFVTHDELIERIWGQTTPRSAQPTLQTYVMRLRRKITADGRYPDPIHTGSHGYQIVLGPDELDLRQFEALVRQAKEAGRCGDLGAQSTLLRRALALWQDPPLGGVSTASFEHDVIPYLTEYRLRIMEKRIDVDLRLGLHDDLIGELRALAAASPMRERPWLQLIQALHRAGRRAEALDTFQTVRRLYREELGLEPSPQLQSAHQDALNGTDAEGAPAAPDPGPAEPEVTAARTLEVRIPKHLPMPPPDFIGRETEMAALTDGLRGHSSTVHVLTGKPGAGKTALSLQVAARVRPAYPNGQLFAHLGGTATVPVSPAEVLARFLRALGQPETGPNVGVDELAALYRTALSGRRVLVVLDDAADEAQVRPLLPGPGGSAALITSRSQLLGLSAAAVTIDVLGPEHAIDLLARIAGHERINAEPQAAEEIALLCGGLPLALRAAAARLKSRANWPLAHLARQLRDERRTLDELRAGDLEVRASLSLSYRRLSDIERRAFRRLGLIGVTEFASWILSPLAEVPLTVAAELAESLADAQLIDPADVDGTGQPRYRLHDLFRVYGAELARAEDTDEERGGALTRTTGQWLGLLNKATRLSVSGTLSLDGTAPAGAETGPDALTDHPQAWFEQERPTLAHALSRPAGVDPAQIADHLASALLSWPLSARHELHEWWTAQQAALAETIRAGRRHEAAKLLTGLGKLRYEQDRFTDAYDFLRRAVDMYDDLDEAEGGATARAVLGKVCVDLDRFDEAALYLEHASVVFAGSGNTAGLAMVNRTLGRLAREQGRIDQSMLYFAVALEAYRSLGSERGEGVTLGGIALAHHAAGRFDQAEHFHLRSARVLAGIGDSLTHAYAMIGLSDARIEQNKLDGVRADLLRAQQRCRDAPDHQGEARALSSLGRLEFRRGEPAAAAAYFRESLAICRTLGMRALAMVQVDLLHRAESHLGTRSPVT